MCYSHIWLKKFVSWIQTVTAMCNSIFSTAVCLGLIEFSVLTKIVLKVEQWITMAFKGRVHADVTHVSAPKVPCRYFFYFNISYLQKYFYPLWLYYYFALIFYNPSKFYVHHSAFHSSFPIIASGCIWQWISGDWDFRPCFPKSPRRLCSSSGMEYVKDQDNWETT